jgi:ribosomal protein S18 acetylase RimI-like enzyme
MTIALRPATPDDVPLLFRVYASTRVEELAVVPWDDATKAAFLWQQFTAQDAHYRAHYTGTAYDVVLRDGAPVGRLYVARWTDEIRVMDIALLPEHRRAGIGGRLLADVLAEGDAAGKRVTIHVERNNPALRLYARLGFRPAADRGVYLFLERAPGAPPDPDAAWPHEAHVPGIPGLDAGTAAQVNTAS